MIFLTSAHARPEPLVSLPRDQETTGSGDENGLERTESGDVTFKAGDNR